MGGFILEHAYPEASNCSLVKSDDVGTSLFWSTCRDNFFCPRNKPNILETTMRQAVLQLLKLMQTALFQQRLMSCLPEAIRLTEA